MSRLSWSLSLSWSWSWSWSWSSSSSLSSSLSSVRVRVLTHFITTYHLPLTTSSFPTFTFQFSPLYLPFPSLPFPSLPFPHHPHRYNSPRAATVRADAESVVWSLNRLTFRTILANSTNNDTAKILSSLRSVDLLKEVSCVALRCFASLCVALLHFASLCFTLLHQLLLLLFLLMFLLLFFTPLTPHPTPRSNRPSSSSSPALSKW